MVRPLLALIGASVIGACGGGGGTPAPDAGPPDGPSIAPPTGPAAATLPSIAPCPPGWREVAASEGCAAVTLCDPWPEGGAATCADDEAHFPGEAGCARIGSACPAGDWPDGLPAGEPVLYVKAGAAAGGDGTAGAPFATLGEAVTAAVSGTIIAVAAGTYDETVQVPAGVTLWGACAHDTRVASSSPSDSSGTLVVSGGDVTIRNLAVGGERPGVWVAGAAARLRLEDVLIAGTRHGGLLVITGAQVDASRLVIRDVQGRPGDARYGRGVHVQGGARLDVARAVIERAREVGVYARDPGTLVTLTGVAVRDTLGETGTDLYGEGLLAHAGADVTVGESVFEGNHWIGLSAGQPSTALRLVDVLVRDTAPQIDDGVSGMGLFVSDGALVEAERLVLAGNTATGASSYLEGALFTATDLVVADTRAKPDGTLGAGLTAHLGGRVNVTRGLLLRNRGAGLMAYGPGSGLTLTDVTVCDTLSQESDLGSGVGLTVDLYATVTATRARIVASRFLGAYVGEAAEAVFEDLVIEATESQESDGTIGRGLDVELGGHVTVTRALLADNREAGVIALQAGTTVSLTDVQVLRTATQACAATTCPGRGGGCGLVAATGAALQATRFSVADSALCGVLVGTASAMDLHEGTVSGSPVGASLQDADYDSARLSDRVVYVDNDRNLDSATIPIPEPSPPPLTP